jgi:hypothetical protein
MSARADRLGIIDAMDAGIDADAVREWIRRYEQGRGTEYEEWPFAQSQSDGHND